MNNQYEFTVFTPCYNSEKFIYRAFQSLNNQTFKDFEWLVIDDFSSDGTKEIISGLQRTSELKINFICNEENKMLAYNSNLAVQQAKGKFFLFLGHDDELVSNALERFFQVWKSIPDTKKKNLVGMMSNCKDEHGNFVDDELPEPPMITDFYNLYYNLGIKGEKFFCYLTNLMKEKNFSVIDKYVPENVMLLGLSDQYDTYFFNENLRIYHRGHDSFTNDLESISRIKYPLGMRYAKLEDINRRTDKMIYQPALFLKTVVNYIRFGKHAEIFFRHTIRDIHNPLVKSLAILLSPIAIILYFRDRTKLK